jgi:hypothetical protein
MQNHMLYWCRLDSPVSGEEVSRRIALLSRKAAGFLSYAWTYGPDSDPPFLGTVRGSTFSLRRDIHYRNSFLPMLKGRIEPLPVGSRVVVIMHLHPVVLVFMLGWFALLGSSAMTVLSSHGPIVAIAPAGLFIFGAAVMGAGFYPEALRARRILEQSLESAGD